jgi:hypothetical protein
VLAEWLLVGFYLEGEGGETYIVCQACRRPEIRNRIMKTMGAALLGA